MKTFHHPLPRIAVAAALATAITRLGGLLFGQRLSNARARELAQGMSNSVQRGVQAQGNLSSFGGDRPGMPAPHRPACPLLAAYVPARAVNRRARPVTPGSPTTLRKPP